MEKYDVISVVGEGSYGLVMRCRHRESGQYVAIKKFLETEDDPTVKKMALREIRMLKKLRHENLVNMLEVFRRKKRFFLVFEYLEHTVLEELEARANGLGWLTSRKYCYQVLRALDFIHSHNVIHRDIKPENVLVSKLGVIKLCDFGFARPYAENETFTDYVATRWYRSPELLVGDPRYGKEVDIWAVGCLFAEMMTGEPLFPGESDIDQLFQIIRVIGKLNVRHQILITKNPMFKGMKQEQNSSINELFPDWNLECLDFLAQCLKMDGMHRYDTEKLLKHQLFKRDDFLDNFFLELKSKLNQEMQGNPLLKRMYSYGSGRKIVGELNKKSSDKGIKKLSDDQMYVNSNKDRINQIGLSLSSSQILNNTKSNLIETNPRQFHHQNTLFTNNNPSADETYIISKHLTTTAATAGAVAAATTATSNQTIKKPISINNLVFKEKHSRILSAKPSQKLIITGNQTNTNQSNFDLQIQPPSPVHFQSLQTDLNLRENMFQPQQQQQQHQQHQQQQHHQQYQSNSQQQQSNNNNNSHHKRLSPVSVTTLLVNGNVPQYFNQKKSSNILGLQQVAASKIKHNGPQQSLIRKRDRPLVDVGLMPLMGGNTPESSTKDISPRILPPPPWLTGNLKITAQGKTTQIGKRGITDWKSISSTTNNNNNNNNHQQQLANNLTSNSITNGGVTTVTAATTPNLSILTQNQKNSYDNININSDTTQYFNNNELLLPNSTAITVSPYKGNKKKLTPMTVGSNNNNISTTGGGGGAASAASTSINLTDLQHL